MITNELHRDQYNDFIARHATMFFAHAQVLLHAKQKQPCKKSARPIRSSIVAIVISDQNL